MLPALLALLVATSPPPAVGDEPQVDASGYGVAPRLVTGEVRTARFRIVHTERARGAAAYLAKEIEPIRDQIREVLGRDWPGVTEVRLGFGREEYEALALPGGTPPSWAVALAYPEANVVLVEAHFLVKGDGQATLRHELVHVALGQLGRGWPRWFQEGLAQELTGERKFRLSQFATLAQAVSRDRVFRFDDLARGFPPEPADVEIAYAQSLAFVEFLHERYGAEKFGELIDLVGAGEPFEKAFGVAFRSPLSAEEKLFREELPRRYPWWPLLVGGGTLAWTLMSVLVIAAFLRRRSALARWTAERRAQEALEDAALALISKARTPANDDAAVEPEPLPLPWLVTVLRSRRS